MPTQYSEDQRILTLNAFHILVKTSNPDEAHMQEHQQKTHFEYNTAKLNPPLTTPNPPLNLLPIPLRMQLLHTVRITLYPPSTPNTLPPSMGKRRTRSSPTATPIRTIAHEEPPHGRPRGGDVDDAIPETH